MLATHFDYWVGKTFPGFLILPNIVKNGSVAKYIQNNETAVLLNLKSLFSSLIPTQIYEYKKTLCLAFSKQRQVGFFISIRIPGTASVSVWMQVKMLWRLSVFIWSLVTHWVWIQEPFVGNLRTVTLKVTVIGIWLSCIEQCTSTVLSTMTETNAAVLER